MESRNKIDNLIYSLLNEVKELIKKNGGFIITNNLNKENGQIYAYVLFGEEYLVEEVKVIGIKVEDNILYIVTCANSINVEVNNIDDFDEDDWYVVESWSDDVLFAQTILSIADSIEQYV